MVCDTVFTADLGDEKTVAFHGSAGLLGKPAGLRIGAFPADPAAAGT